MTNCILLTFPTYFWTNSILNLQIFAIFIVYCLRFDSLVRFYVVFRHDEIRLQILMIICTLNRFEIEFQTRRRRRRQRRQTREKKWREENWFGNWFREVRLCLCSNLFIQFFIWFNYYYFLTRRHKEIPHDSALFIFFPSFFFWLGFISLINIDLQTLSPAIWLFNYAYTLYMVLKDREAIHGLYQ